MYGMTLTQSGTAYPSADNSMFSVGKFCVKNGSLLLCNIATIMHNEKLVIFTITTYFISACNMVSASNGKTSLVH